MLDLGQPLRTASVTASCSLGALVDPSLIPPVVPLLTLLTSAPNGPEETFAEEPIECLK